MADIKRKAPFIKSDETLLIFVQDDSGRYIHETAYLHESLDTAEDTQKFIDATITFPEQIVRVVRFDTETLTGEDVTAALAEYRFEVA